MDLLGLGHLRLNRFDQTTILGQTQHVVELAIVLAVPHDLITTKPRVPTHNDSHLWPRRSDLFDYSSQLGEHPAGRILIGLAQPRTQQVLATEDIQRQVAILGIIAVEILPLLITVKRIIGGIHVEYDLNGAL